MKSFYFLFTLSMALNSFGQKNDYVWFISLASNDEARISFLEAPPLIEIVNYMPDFNETNSSFADENGNLLYHTNGLTISDNTGNPLENGNGLNPGYVAENLASNGYRVLHAAFFLPFPDDSTKCILFHMFADTLPGIGYALKKFLYTIIDRTANNGLGKVMEKNVPLLVGSDTLNFNHAGAVRHANGRDWWIVVPNTTQPIYYRFLLSPTGIDGPFEQQIGFPPNEPDPVVLYSSNGFSPDGSKYLDFETYIGEGFQVFDFDRCTGLLSNPILVHYDTGSSISSPGGFAFSPSGRFVYATYVKDNRSRLVQYDLYAPDIEASEFLIDKCETTHNFVCSYTDPLLAPNNKIYVTALIDTVAYHIIHQPDSLGLACNLEFGGFEIGKFPNFSPPYFPNYRLYDVPDSPCDTLGIDDPNIEPNAVSEVEGGREFSIYPNPSSGDIEVIYELGYGEKGEVMIYSQSGRLVRRFGLSSSSKRLNVNGLAPGFYNIRFSVDGLTQRVEKLIVH